MSDAPLPIEDRENGLYLNRATTKMPDGVRVLVVTATEHVGRSHGSVVEERASYYVRAEDFMAVQMERDGLRRAMGLINAWRFAHFVEFGPTSRLDGEHRRTLQRLLADEGFGDEGARAMLGIIRGLGKSV